MFGRIPQRLPFGLLSDEAKLAFRAQPEGISKLFSTRHISNRSSYWDQYLTLFDSASDVYSLVLPHDIRRALTEAPENVSTLLNVLVGRLENLIVDHTFPSSTSSSVASLASAFVRSGLTERNPNKEALNAVRALQRVLPVVYELDIGTNTFEADVLWGKQPAGNNRAEIRPQSPQFVIDNEDEEDGEPNIRRAVDSSMLSTQKPTLRPALAERLIDVTMKLLFCCGFTLPQSIQVDHQKINFTIWERGIGSTLELPSAPSMESHKVEVLRLLLVLLSRQIYIPPNVLLSKPSLYSLYLVQTIPRRHILTILCSLINTALSPRTNNTNIMSGMRLPYDHLVFKGEDIRITLVATSLQVLNALLDFQSGPARDVVTQDAEKRNSSPTSQTNGFRYFLAKLHRTQDFAFLVNGLVDILETYISSIGGLLPGSKKPLPYAVECLLFTWKLFDVNQKFRIYMLNSGRAADFVSYLLVLALEIKDKPREHGMCRAISHMLQMLSAEPSFGSLLSSPTSPKIPARWISAGTVGDFLVNSVYTLISTTSGSLGATYPALAITLSNAGPYFTNLNLTASTRLVQLYSSFAKPSFLLSDEAHPRLLYFVLEVFNGVISHHLAENPHLIYAILSSHQSFEALSSFTLRKGLHDIVNARRPNEEGAVGRTGSKVGATYPGTRDGEVQDSKPQLRGSSETDDLELGLGQPTASPSNFRAEVTSSPSSSEKVRGKMKQRRSSSSDTLLNEALTSVSGRNGFTPTEDWVASWQQGLPLDPILILIVELLPKTREMQALQIKSKQTSVVVDYISSVSLESAMPRGQVAPRPFVWTDTALVWLTSLMWGEIYVHNVTPLALWTLTNVRLFQIKQNQQRQLGGTVSTVVGGLLGRGSTSDVGPQG